MEFNPDAGKRFVRRSRCVLCANIATMSLVVEDAPECLNKLPFEPVNIF